MKRILFAAVVLCLFANCEEEFVPVKASIQGKWKSGNQEINFLDERVGLNIVPASDGLDSMLFDYSFVADTFPMQIDINIKNGLLKGLYMYGLVEFTHPDTFRMVSRRGFEGQPEKYRPKTIDPGQAAVYARVKEAVQ